MQPRAELREARPGRPAARGWPVPDPGLLLILGLFVLFVAFIVTVPAEDAFAVLPYVPIAVALAVVAYATAIKPADDGFSAALYWLAFVLKLLSVVAYYWMLMEVYGGGDANRYHLEATYISQHLRQSDFSILRVYGYGRQSSTNVIYLTSFLYTILPPSRLGGGLVFAALAFVGSVFHYRAFRRAFPAADSRLYLMAVFFMPSVLFWTSAVGKDAWVFFGSGIVSWGLVTYARRAHLSGLVVAGLGLGLVYLVRPHFAAFMVLAAGIAFLLFHRVRSSQRLLIWLVGAAVIAGGGFLVVGSAGEFLGLGSIGEVSFQEVEEFYDFRQAVSTGGGSGFETRSALDPVGLVTAPVTVLLRPFPWEANNPQALVTALESLAWLGIFWWRRRVFWERLRAMRHDPWVAFSLGYTAILIVALTTAGNFGIIARQRVGLLPFLWVLFG